MQSWFWPVILALGVVSALGLLIWLDERIRKGSVQADETEGLYCPKCGTQYREGFHACADCGTTLSRGTPPATGPDYVELAEAISSNDMNEIMFLKSLFDGHGIRYVAQGDHHFKTSNNFGIYALAVRFLVPAEQLQEAKELVKQHFEGGSAQQGAAADPPRQ